MAQPILPTSTQHRIKLLVIYPIRMTQYSAFQMQLGERRTTWQALGVPSRTYFTSRDTHGKERLIPTGSGSFSSTLDHLHSPCGVSKLCFNRLPISFGSNHLEGSSG
ncbi:hypothetical protein YC2023_102015 [Brassica napus]